MGYLNYPIIYIINYLGPNSSDYQLCSDYQSLQEDNTFFYYVFTIIYLLIETRTY